MYIPLLVLLPLFIAAFMAVIYKLRHHRRADAIMLSVIFATVIANGIATVQCLHNQEVDLGIYMLQATLSCLIVPFSYIYFSHTLGRGIASGTTIITSALVLLMLLPDICIFDTMSNDRQPGGYDFIVPHCINFIRDGRNVFHITIESFVIVLQSLIVLRRIIMLARQLRRYELTYTRRTRAFVVWAVSCAVFAIIYHAMPARTWAGSTGAWIDFSIYAILGLWGFLTIALNMEIYTLVTRDGAETVQLDHFIDANRDLASRMRQLFDTQQIYLQHGIVIDDAARMLGTNRTYFTRMMRAEFGMTFTEYLQKARVDYCKQCLRTSDVSLEDIAFRSGFGSASTLTRVFKKLTGETPDAFRKGNTRQ